VRAYETAKHIANEIDYPIEKILVDEQLIERDFGKLEGKKELVAATKYLFNESAIDKYDGVESLGDLQVRANKLLVKLKNMPQDAILIVGHGAFGRALQRAVNGNPIHKRGNSFANCEIIKLI